MAQGVTQAELWEAAVDVLLALRCLPAPETITGNGVLHRLPVYDASVMREEVGLFADWYWPHVTGAPMPEDVRGTFTCLWRDLIDAVAGSRGHWVLRDYHSPNLIWLPERQGIQRVGLIDFQDAQAGHAAYDLASLLQDARIDVPRERHDGLLARYCRETAQAECTFDEAAFRRDFAILAAQRATKILGIFARLDVRDGKPQYLRHLPRIWRYLGWNLEEPALNGLRDWLERHLPSSRRTNQTE